MIYGCAGDSGSDIDMPVSSTVQEIASELLAEDSTEVTWDLGVFESWRNLSQVCVNPRNNENYNDRLGTVAHENNWIRSYSDDTYLWYQELPDIDPRIVPTTSEYFELMKTDSLSESGAPKDKYHFTEDTETWNDYFQRGANVGYGMRLASSTESGEAYRLFVLYSEPQSPAAIASLKRGTEIISINNEAVSGGLSQSMYDSLFPGEVGEENSFEVILRGSDQSQELNITSSEIVITPVQKVSIFDHGGATVGYLLFNQHIASAEKYLVEAIEVFKDSSIDHLILDMRYNGGGYLRIASQLAYMIAGQPAINRVFDRSTFNDKHPFLNPITQERIDDGTFLTTTQGMSLTAGDPLPALDLEKVYVLSTDQTCSASEALINGLRGIDIEVVLIGGATCGKPYGFYGIDNCGTTYLTIQIKGTNAKGFGDFSDGFIPSQTNVPLSASVGGCAAIDSIFGEPLGQRGEPLLSTALHYIDNEACPDSQTIHKKQKTSLRIKSGVGDREQESKWAVKLL
ncbi:MAG: peptidase [Cellvibrionales bacterium TMED148]|nr:peptidase [Porticoccaceae bacterium]RPG90039.1 MAG: peptidase [Cellvibrionales bacterium TMED148]